LPQPEYVLKASEVLPVGWHSEGRRLKGKVSDPNNVQNPEFPFPGLYSVHATLKIETGDRTVLLRSNEQIVAVGASRESPKHSYGQLIGVDADAKTTTLRMISWSRESYHRGSEARHVGRAQFSRLTQMESIGFCVPINRRYKNSRRR